MICNCVESNTEHMRSPAFDSCKLAGDIPLAGRLPFPSLIYGSWGRPFFLYRSPEALPTPHPHHANLECCRLARAARTGDQRCRSQCFA
jgi:hypothetical protein